MKEMEAKRKNSDLEKEGLYYIDLRNEVYKAYSDKYNLGDFNWFFSR